MLNPKLPIIIRFPLCIDQLQREADAICDLSMGLSLEEIVNDSAAIYLGNLSIECWLEYVENTIWYEHVSNDSYYEIKSFCSTFMQYLLDKYKLLNLPVLNINNIDAIDVEFNPDYIDIIVQPSEDPLHEQIDRNEVYLFSNYN